MLYVAITSGVAAQTGTARTGMGGIAEAAAMARKLVRDEPATHEPATCAEPDATD